MRSSAPRREILLTIQEIADRLQEQPGAVKSRLHRARELVREYLLATAAGASL